MDTITRILELAKQRDISQKHLCSLVVVSRTYLSMTKGRRTVPPEKYLRVWAQELRTSLDYLQCKTDDPSPEALLGNEKEPGTMARRCNAGGLDPVQLPDVLEDALCSL